MIKVITRFETVSSKSLFSQYFLKYLIQLLDAMFANSSLNRKFAYHYTLWSIQSSKRAPWLSTRIKVRTKGEL